MLDEQEQFQEVQRYVRQKINSFDWDKDPTEVLEEGAQDIVLVGEATTPLLTSNVTAKNLWHHPDTHPVILDVVLLKKYGPEWLGWETETLRRLIPQDFKSNLSELNISKMNAIKTLHLVDTYWEDWEVFLWCSMALNGIFPDFEVLQAPTVAQCLVSVDIANHLRDDMPWGAEVKTFIEVCFRHESLFVRIEPINFIDIQRDSSLADFKSIESRWPSVRSSKKAPTGETVEDEQLRHMLTAYEYLEESRAHLRHQLSLVRHV